MPTDSYSDIRHVHRYLDRVTDYIKGFVGHEPTAVTLACQVFESHRDMDRKTPFTIESGRIKWLETKALRLSRNYLQNKILGEINAGFPQPSETLIKNAIRKAIRETP